METPNPSAVDMAQARKELEDFDDYQFVVSFNKVQEKMNQTAHDKGWYESKLSDLVEAHGHRFGLEAKEAIKAELKSLEDARRIALIHSEGSEALEGLRHGNNPSDHIPEFSAAEEELADIIIRAMDISQERGWRLGDAIIAKAKFNANRSHRHGGKKF